MSTSAPNQTLRCVGEIRVDTTGDASKEAKGTIRFVDQTSTNFGQLRVYGFGGQGELVLDVLGVTEGFNVKTINTQGSATFGGNGEPYAFRVKGEEARCKYLTLSSTRSNYNKQTGINQLNVTRDSTVDSSTTLTSTLGTFTQGEFKFGEGIFTNIGSSSNGRAWFGWRTPLASTSATTNYGVLGMTTTSNISTFVENVKLNTDGSVNIPNRLDVGTIYATNYLNLPPTPTPNLSPITLDQVNNRVGINNTSPSAGYVLDINGNVNITGGLDIVTGMINCDTLNANSLSNTNISGVLEVSSDTTMYADATVVGDLDAGNFSTSGNVTVTGTMTAGTVSATNYVGLPVSSLTPITLDAPNNRVGINQVSPTEALDVTGNANVSGTVTAGTVSATHYVGLTPLTLDTTYTRLGVNKSIPDYTLHVGGDAGVDGTLHANTVSANTYLGLGSSLTPLTLDTTTSRLGINQSAPNYTLDVVGDAAVSGTQYCGTLSANAFANIPNAVGPYTLYFDPTTGVISYAE